MNLKQHDLSLKPKNQHSIPVTDIHKQQGYNKSFNTERTESVEFFLKKLGTETKLQRFNLNNNLKGSLDFT